MTTGRYFFLLFLEENHDWVSGVIQQALEVHGVMQLLFRIYGLIKTEVVMPLLQSLKCYVSIVRTEWVRL